MTARWTTSRWLPLGLLAGIAALDAVAGLRHWPQYVVGLLDEPAHLATAWLLLVALLPMRARSVRPWALLGAVAIDVDHVPLYAWGALSPPDGGRPVTHSLATVLVLLAGALAWPRLRGPLLGLSGGVLLHLVRDLATGPGAPLAWPIESSSVRLPYPVYAAVLVAAALTATVRSVRRTRHRSAVPRPGG